ncbi:MAG: type IV pilus secretin PilQ [Nitrospirota bacterium]
MKKRLLLYYVGILFISINLFLCNISYSEVNAPVSLEEIKTEDIKKEIKDIVVKEFSDKTVVMIKADTPILYTAFQLIDPLRLVIDMSGISLGRFKEKMDIDSETIRSILTSESDKPTRVARLEIFLADANNNVDFNTRTKGDTLIIDILKSFASLPGSEEIEVAESISPFSDKNIKRNRISRAENITGIEVDRNDESITVIIKGDGELQYNVFTLDDNRVVLDIPNTINRVTPALIPGNSRLLKSVRIGQHLDPKKVRVVLDLMKPLPYYIDKTGEMLIVNIKVPKAPRKMRKMVSKTDTAPSVTGKREEVTPVVINEMEKKKAASKKYMGRKISLDFQDADIVNIIRLISEVSNLNIVIGEGVQGRITLKLIDIPWDQALDTILKMNNLGMIREGNILRIATVSNIVKQQEEELRARETKIKVEDIITKVIYVNYAKAENLAEIVSTNLSKRGSITIDSRTNTIIVKDTGDSIKDITEVVKMLDTRTPQVLIEARIVQVVPEFNRSLGIQWGATFADVSRNNAFNITAANTGAFGTITPDFAVNLPAAVLSPTPSVGFSFGKFTDNPINLDLRLSAGEFQGLTNIISTPKITVLDNQEAKIEQGESIPFSTISQNGTQTTFVDANLTLVVKPHVTTDGSIMLEVKAAKNAPGTTRQGAAGPSIEKREATTTIMLRNGETTVIGGIYESTKSESSSRVPFLSDIPFLGWLFKNKETREKTTELLVFLTPTIVK